MLSAVAACNGDGSPLKRGSRAVFSDETPSEVPRPWLGFSTSIWTIRMIMCLTTNSRTG